MAGFAWAANSVAHFGLVVPFVLAMVVLFGSPDIDACESNVALFYTVAIWCTLLYFVFSCWDLRRGKAQRRSALENADENALAQQ